MHRAVLTTGETVVNQIKTNESGYHCKNGTSWKRRTNRGNIVQTTFLFVIAFCVSVASAFAMGINETSEGVMQTVNGNDPLSLPTEIHGIADASLTFEYDNQHRITKITTNHWYWKDFLRVETLSYNSAGDLIAIHTSVSEGNSSYSYNSTFTKNGNKITGTGNDDIIIELNSQGLPEKITTNMTVRTANSNNPQRTGNFSEANYLYQNGNVSRSGSNVYTYDDKKSPFYHCNTPKWFFFIRDLGSSFGLQNNIINQDYGNGHIIAYELTYNDEGFPVTKTWFDEDDRITVYQYEQQDYSAAPEVKPAEVASINPATTETDRASNEPALLHMYRKRNNSSLSGLLRLRPRYDILLDNTVVGQTTDNWKTIVSINTFGTKTFSAMIDGRKAEARINFQPGGVYYVCSDVDSKTVNTGRTRTTRNKNGPTTTTAVTEIQYTPILQLVDKSIGESEFNAIK